LRRGSEFGRGKNLRRAPHQEQIGPSHFRPRSVLPVEARESSAIQLYPFRNDRVHIRFPVLSCPLGAMDYGGHCYPGLFCNCPFGALGRSDHVGRALNGPAKPRRNGLTANGPPCPKQTGYAPAKPSSVENHPCPEGAKHVSPGQSEAAQQPSAALGKRPPPHVRRPEGARQMRHKRTKSCVEMIQRPESHGWWPIRCRFVWPVEARESMPSISIRVQMIVSTSGSRSCRAPSGR
jgi:hypothetical protein